MGSVEPGALGGLTFMGVMFGIRVSKEWSIYWRLPVCGGVFLIGSRV